uniref:Nectin cell adhesion molecule 3 n=1 Tax=Sphenodon punctatus TaxID=8508 RepID=A0A8D0HL86_SPHPU
MSPVLVCVPSSLLPHSELSQHLPEGTGSRGQIQERGIVLAQRVKVRDAVTGYVGEEVTLPCKFATTSTDIKVSQVTWVKEMGARKQSVAVYHPDHGPSYPTEQSSGRIHFLTPSLADATLIIGPLRMDDEGTYTCEFATYPLGNEDGVTRLIMLAKPTNTAEAREVMAGGPVTPVAVCTSAHGKPPASITWQTPGLSGNANASEVTNPDGTITVISQYNMAPVAEANEKRITCIVEHDTLTQAEALPVMLSVLYPPQVSIEGYDDNWYLSRSEAVLKCVAKGNPAPSQFNSLSLSLCPAQPNTAGAGATGGIIGGIIAAIVAMAVMATGFLIFLLQELGQGICRFPSHGLSVHLQEVPRYHELPTLEEREGAMGGETGPSLEDEYLDQINPIYDALSFAADDGGLPAIDKAFVMSRAMYV